MTEKITTKKCPSCGCTDLILYTSLNKKGCPDCGEMIDWYLDKGQLPIFKNARGDSNRE